MTVDLSNRQRAQAFFEGLQDMLCRKLEEIDGKRKFSEDRWDHPDHGGGRTRILQDGGVFEKAGVNTSSITTTLSKTLAERLDIPSQTLFATGISIVLHPQSPMIPSVHANFRYLEPEKSDSWFGGGADLTPYYLFDEDARHFHSIWKRACDHHDESYYQKFKHHCDEYFLLRHRKETRGVGGIFFDNLKGEFDRLFPFVQECGNSFLDAYAPIVARRRDEPWGEQEKRWQLVRRGRYVEFNLIYDRGTVFGLETGGRIESILISLPPEVRWDYNPQPSTGSREERLVEILRNPRTWV